MGHVYKKLLFAMIVNIVLTAAAILAVMLLGMGQIVDRLAIDDMEASMRTIGATMGQKQSTSFSASVVLAQNQSIIQAVESADSLQLQDRLETLLREAIPHSTPCVVTITDERGYVIARTHSDETGDNIALRHGISYALQGGFLSDFELEGENLIGIVSTAPIIDNAGYVIGTVAVGYDLGVENFVEHLRDITNSEITVFARDLSVMSTIIMGDGSGERAVGTRLRSDIADAVLDRQEIFHEQTQIPPRPGETFLVHYVPITDETGAAIGVIFAGQNLTHVLSIENRATWLSVSIAGAAIIIAVILSMFIMRAMIALRIEKSMEESRTKSKFLAHMSHEIRTPLNGIIGMLNIAKKTAEAEERNYYLDKIDVASHHLLSVVNEVLDISKIEAGKLELYTHSFDFNRMINNITTGILGIQLREKELNLTVEVDKEIPPFIISDEMRVTQIIINLLNNAMKFSHQGGNINIKATYLTGKGRCFLCIEITDEGIGMTEEQQTQLFNDFSQAEANTAHKYGGTGLGLSICKRLVEIMSGRIWVKSESGKGSTFTFAIPFEACNAPRDTQEATDAPACYKGYTVLLVDDVEINREIAMIQLEETGLDVDCADSGAQAVQMFIDSPERYSMILMDLRMPEMDGITATRYIRSFNTPKAKSIPIIATTASILKEEIDMCLEAGMCGHLGKPMDSKQVLEILETHLR